jgi:hypothetical protein
MTRKLPANLPKLFAEHMAEDARCYEWSAKAVRYREAGDWRRAERAEDRAFRCLQRMKQLKDRAQVYDTLTALNST